jgi:hypothetical protein
MGWHDGPTCACLSTCQRAEFAAQQRMRDVEEAARREALAAGVRDELAAQAMAVEAVRRQLRTWSRPLLPAAVRQSCGRWAVSVPVPFTALL